MAEPKRKRVLLLEDDAQVAQILERLLAPLDVDVEWAPDGTTALEAAAARPPDLLIADLELPDLHGLETLRLIQQTLGSAAPRTVVLTGHPNAPAVKEAVALGVVDFLTKPSALTAKGLERLRRHIPA